MMNRSGKQSAFRCSKRTRWRRVHEDVHQANDVACCSLCQITRVRGECVGMRLQVSQFRCFAIGRTNACINSFY